LKEENPLKIDGSFGEGGGAILRLSAAFSFLFNRPIKIINIRANRPKPGLRTQHLLGLKTLANLTGSSLSKCQVGTTDVAFTPKKHIKNTLHVNINTAASIGLLLQPIQIASLGLNSSEKIEIFLTGGGTFGKWAPSISYLQNVTYPIFNKTGSKIDISVLKHGWYPKGGASVKCVLYPFNRNLKQISLIELGNIDLIKGEIIVTNQLKKPDRNIGEIVKNSIQQTLKYKIKADLDIAYKWVESLSPGVGLSLWATSDTGAIISTGTILGEKKIPAEKLGLTAANEILKYICNDIPVDKYLSDQLIPLMAYINAPSSIKVLDITSHTRTNLELIKLFTQRQYTINKSKNHYIIEYSN
jgi:RNA 3'-terminal phosphate cyclase (ATP)/RNA 3'-terminal phosphate cyclase (GTP)